MRKFVKDGHEVETGSPAQAVTLLRTGYQEITDDSPRRKTTRAGTGPRTEVRRESSQHQAPDTGS